MSDSKPIKGTDVIDKDLFKEHIEQADVFISKLDSAKKSIIALNKATSQKLKDVQGGTKSSELKEQNRLMAESIKQRALVLASEKLQNEQVAYKAKLLRQQEDAQKKANQETEKAATVQAKQNSLFVQAKKHLNDMRNQFRELSLSGKGAEQSTKDLKKQIGELDEKLSTLNESIGDFHDHVGEYKNQVKEAITESGLFEEGLASLGQQTSATVLGFGQIIKQLKGVKEGQEAAATGTKKLTNVLKASGIAAIIAVLGSLFAYFKSSREGADKFELAMNKLKGTLDIMLGSVKRIGEGIANLGSSFVSFVSGDFSEATTKAKDGIKGITTAFDGNVEAIKLQIKGLDELTEKISRYEDEIRILQVEQHKLNLLQGDLAEIAADDTRSLNEQQEALKKSNKLEAEGAQIGLEIVNKELEITKDQLVLALRKNGVSEDAINLAKKQGLENFSASKISLKANNDEINAIQDKYIAQLTASNSYSDILTNNAKRQREIDEQTIKDQIEIIRSKRLAANEEVAILTQQINNEKYQLEQREIFQDQLNKKNVDSTNLEINLLAKLKTAKGEQAVTAEEVQDLINTKNSVELADKLLLLRRLKLSESAYQEVAKVVKIAQDNEIQNEVQIAKNQEDEIKRLNKIEELNMQIAIVKSSVKVDVEGYNYSAIQRSANKSQQTLLEGDNIFNAKLIRQHQNETSLELDLLQKKIEAENTLSEQQYELDRKQTIDSVTDHQTKEKQLELLDEKNKEQQLKAERAHQDELKALADKTAEEKRAVMIAQAKYYIQDLENATQATAQAYDQRTQLQQQQQQVQISRTEAAIEQQQNLAQRGLANSLAYEQQQLAQQQLAQQDALKKAAKVKEDIATVQALFSAYNTELNQPDATPLSAAGKAVADVLAFKAVAASITQFAADGNDDVDGPGSTTSDSIPFMLSKHEGVVKAEANINNKGVVKALNAGTFSDLYMPRYNIGKSLSDVDRLADKIMSNMLMQQNDVIIKELRAIKEKPIQQVDVDGFGNIIETVIAGTMKTVTMHKQRKSRI